MLGYLGDWDAIVVPAECRSLIEVHESLQSVNQRCETSDAKGYKEHEVDIVGFTTDRTIVVRASKFTIAPLDCGALASLEEDTAKIRSTLDTAKRNSNYALLTRGGATQSVREAVTEHENVRLFDLGNITEQPKGAIKRQEGERLDSGCSISN